MGRPPKEYKSGQLIGQHGLVLVKEWPSINKGTYKERRIEVICPVCKKTFITDLRRVVRKDTAKKKSIRQCPNCSQKESNKRISKIGKQSIVDLSEKVFGKLTVMYPTDKRASRSVVWHCKCECGNEVDVSSVDLQRKHTKSCGCLKSKGEEKIGKILQSLNISFEKEKTFDNCINPKTKCSLRFDFYLPDYNCCIEYDGEQHFKEWKLCRNSLIERQELDSIKNQYCEKNDIKLIRIPYWDYDKLDLDFILNQL